LRIRWAYPSDAIAVAAVMRAAIRKLAAPFHAPALVAAWSSLPPLYHAWAMTVGGERYAVAERGRRVAGYAALRGTELTALFVRPRCAGRGVGRALLARVERDARRRGLRALRVKAVESAARFYALAGFRGRASVRVALPGGLVLPAVSMRKRLTRTPDQP
jgi:GNAT superfamily N-acetyltransferase